MISGDVYECSLCGEMGPYHKFIDHAAECMKGAPAPEPGESFQSHQLRVKQWKKTGQESR